MKAVRYEGSFSKDIKRIAKRNYKLQKLEAVIDLLRSDSPLPLTYHAHRLKGGWLGWWECHIASDWLLIYNVRKEEVLLARTGTHADLFE